MMKRSRFFFWLAALAVLCLALTAAAAAETAPEVKLAPASSMMFDEWAGILQYTTQHTDGSYKLAIDVDNTDWQMFMMANAITSDWDGDAALKLKVPAEASGYVAYLSNSLDFDDDTAIVAKLEDYNRNGWNRHMIEDWETPGDMNFGPVWEMLTYDAGNQFFSPRLHPQWRNPYASYVGFLNEDGEIYEVQKMTVDISFSREGWFVEPVQKLSSDVYVSTSHETMSTYIAMNGDYVVEVTPSLIEDLNRAAIYVQYIIPEGAAACIIDGARRDLESYETEFSNTSSIYDWFKNDIVDHTLTMSVIWLDASGNVMPQSGLLSIRVDNIEVNTSISSDNTWMHYAQAEDNRWGPLEPWRLAANTNSDLPFGEDEGVLYWDLRSDGVEFCLNADNLTIDELENMAFTSYSIALGNRGTWEGASKYTVLVHDIDYLYGPNPEQAQWIMERLVEQYENDEDVWDASEVGFQHVVFEDQYFRRLTSGYHGTDIFASRLQGYDDEGGEVCYFGWFDDAGELIRIDWLRVAGRSDDLIAAAQKVSSLSAITEPVKNPVLVAGDDNEMFTTFKAQEVITEEDGYKGYLVELDINGELDGSEKVVLPYALGADPAKHDFRLTVYNGFSAENVTSFEVADNGVVFTPAQQKGAYVLNWKEPEKLTLTTLSMEDVTFGDFGGALVYTNNSTDGHLNITIDTAATDWDRLVFSANGEKGLYLPFTIVLSDEAVEGLYIEGYTQETDDEILAAMEAKLKNGELQEIVNHAVTGNLHFASYDDETSAVTPSPIATTAERKYRITIPCINSASARRLDAVYCMDVDISFTDSSAVEVQTPVYDLAVRAEAEMPIEWSQDEQGGMLLFDSALEYDWKNAMALFSFQAPEGAKHVRWDGVEHEVSSGSWQISLPVFQQGDALVQDARMNVSLLWLDENMNPLAHSGVFTVRILDSNTARGKTWMELENSETWGPLDASRLEVRIDHSAEGNPFVFTKEAGFVHHFPNPTYNYTAANVQGLLEDDMFCIANYRVTVPAGAAKLATDCWVYEGDILGYNKELYNDVMNSILQRPRKDVKPGDKAEKSGYDNFMEVVENTQDGIKTAKTVFKSLENKSGIVFYYAWFDANDELIKVEWLCETGEEMVFRKEGAVYSNNGEVPMNLTEPVLVDHAGSGARLSVGFVPQQSIAGAGGMRGYMAELTVMDANGETVPEPRMMSAFMPYPKDVEIAHTRFQLLCIANGAQEEVRCQMGMSGVSFDMEKNGVYLLKWKENKPVYLPARLDEIEPYAFANSAFASVRCPDGMASIGAYAFKNCADLEVIYIGSDTVIDETAFDGCTSLVLIQSDMMGCPAHDLADKLGIVFQINMN